MNIEDTKILFMGTPEISAYVLEKLILDGFHIVGIISQPDRPSGRHHQLEPTPTKVIGEKYQIPVYQKEKIRNDYDFIYKIKPDLILTLAYGQIVPQGLLDIPILGCLNLHGSILPKYRGAAPIQYALINNEKETGMTLMQMIDKMDAGKIYAFNKITIEEEDNSSSLFRKMGEAAYQLAKEFLPKYVKGELIGVEQDESKVTFCPTIKKEQEKLDLSNSVDTIYGYIRALSDQPGGYFLTNEGKLKIYKSKIVSHEIKGNVGEIIQVDKTGIYLQCKDGILNLLELQKEGKKRLDYKNFINGNQNLLHQILK